MEQYGVINYIIICLIDLWMKIEECFVIKDLFKYVESAYKWNELYNIITSGAHTHAMDGVIGDKRYLQNQRNLGHMEC